MEEGFFSLGIKEIKDEFVAPPIFSLSLDQLSILIIYVLIKGRHFLYKIIEKPSGLGALSGFKAKTTFWTSSSEICQARDSLFSSEISLGISSPSCAMIATSWSFSSLYRFSKKSFISSFISFCPKILSPFSFSSSIMVFFLCLSLHWLWKNLVFLSLLSSHKFLERSCWTQWSH